MSDDTGRGEETHWVFLGGKSGKREEKRDETKQKRKVAVKLREVTSYRPRNFHPVFQFIWIYAIIFYIYYLYIVDICFILS